MLSKEYFKAKIEINAVLKERIKSAERNEFY